MKLAPEFQRHDLENPTPTPALIAQLTAAIELMNKRLVGHDYIRPLLFVVVIEKGDKEETMAFDVFERAGIGGARNQFGLNAAEMDAAKKPPLTGYARLFFITPETRGACDVRVAEERTARQPVTA